MTVFGSLHIHFQHICTQFHGTLKGIKGAFRTEASTASMRYDEKIIGLQIRMVRCGFGEYAEANIKDE
jgi:hypothetical protein